MNWLTIYRDFCDKYAQLSDNTPIRIECISSNKIKKYRVHVMVAFIDACLSILCGHGANARTKYSQQISLHSCIMRANEVPFTYENAVFFHKMIPKDVLIADPDLNRQFIDRVNYYLELNSCDTFTLFALSAYKLHKNPSVIFQTDDIEFTPELCKYLIECFS